MADDFDLLIAELAPIVDVLVKQLLEVEDKLDSYDIDEDALKSIASGMGQYCKALVAESGRNGIIITKFAGATVWYFVKARPIRPKQWSDDNINMDIALELAREIVLATRRFNLNFRDISLVNGCKGCDTVDCVIKYWKNFFNYYNGYHRRYMLMIIRQEYFQPDFITIMLDQLLFGSCLSTRSGKYTSPRDF